MLRLAEPYRFDIRDLKALPTGISLRDERVQRAVRAFNDKVGAQVLAAHVRGLCVAVSPLEYGVGDALGQMSWRTLEVQRNAAIPAGWTLYGLRE